MLKPVMDISSVERWLLGNSLPWSNAIESKLVSLGVIFVEHLKACTQDEWDGLFAFETVITKRVAARVFACLKRDVRFGSDARLLTSFASLADASQFVLVLPEGLENFFNTRN